ncbi:MAG: hypothetical protein Q9227_006166, partial [Pyrenula ochraceoflavens]
SNISSLSSTSSSAMDIRPRSSSSYTTSSRSGSTGGYGFNAWPYRTCLNGSKSEEPSSYLSDDDLLPLPSSTSDVDEHALVSAPSSIEELSTEDVIARFRQQAEEEEQRRRQMQQDRRPHVWWQQEDAATQQRRKERKVSFPGEKKRRPGMGKRKSSGKVKTTSSQTSHE